MRPSLVRAPARLLVLAVALGGTLAVGSSAEAAALRPPAPASDVDARSTTPGEVAVTWTPSPAPDAFHDATESYLVTLTHDGALVASTTVPASRPATTTFEDLAPQGYTVEVTAQDGDRTIGGAYAPERSTMAFDVVRVSDGRPGSVVASRGAATALTVGWAAPVRDADDVEPLRYEVTVTGPGSTTTVVPLAASATSYRHALTGPGSYSATVAAVYRYADGAEVRQVSDPAPPVVVHAAPGAPQSPVAAARAPQQVTVTWSASVVDTSAGAETAVASYVVRELRNGALEREQTVSGSTLQSTFTDLPAGTARSYEVVAVDRHGVESAPSDRVSATTYDVGAPTDVTAAQDRDSVGVAWRTPTAGPRPDGYRVELLRTGSSTVAYRSQSTLGSGVRSYVVSGVVPASYDVRVVATYDDAVASERTATSGVTVTDGPDAPGVPGLVQLPGRPGSVEVSWAAPAQSHGYQVTRYVVSLLRDGVEVASSTVAADQPLQAGFDDLAPGSHRVVVTAESDGADSSSRSVDLDVVRLPGAVGGLAVTQPGRGELRLTWARPDGAEVAGYRLEVSGPNGTRTILLPADATSATVGDLPLGRQVVRLVAVAPNGLAGTPLSVGVDVRDMTPVSGTGAPLVRAKGGVDAGEKARVSGTARKGAKLQLQARAISTDGSQAAGAFAAIGKVKATKKGRYVFTKAFTRNVEVRVVDLATGVATPSTVVLVASRVTVKAVRTGTRTYRLAGKVAPAGPGRVVTVQVQQGSAPAVVVGRATTDAAGRFALTRTFASSGSAVVTAVTGATPTNEAGAAVTRLRVR